MGELEYRNFRASVKVRDDDPANVADGVLRLVGYAATFNSVSQELEDEDGGKFVEILAPGCFSRSLVENDIRSFWNHDIDGLPLARTSAGNLKLTEDATGLAFEIMLPDTTLARDLYACVKAGLVDGVSFGFYSRSDTWSPDGYTNTIADANLVEISPVNYPAYLATSVKARSLDRMARRPKPDCRLLARARAIIAIDDEI